MLPYNVERTNAALSTTIDHLIIVGGIARGWALVEYDGQGESNASVANMVGIYVVTGAGTGTAPTAIVPVTPARSAGNTFSGTAYGSLTGYTTTQPTVTSVIQRFSVNANGGRPYWKANVNFNNAIWMPSTANSTAIPASTLCIRGITVPSATPLSLRVGFIEV
jgi:hypothetical protein